jgi:hypothetical protein
MSRHTARNNLRIEPLQTCIGYRRGVVEKNQAGINDSPPQIQGLRL